MWFLKNVFMFNWRIIALQHCVGFCQMSTWTSHITVALICTSVITNDVEHLWYVFLAICISSLEKVFESLCSFLNWAVCLSVVELLGFFFFFFKHSGYKFLIKCMICKYFFPFCEFFTLLIVSFDAQKLLILMKSSLIFLLLLCWYHI